MVEFLDAHDRNGKFVKSQERVSLLKEIQDYSMIHGDSNLGVSCTQLVLKNTQDQLYIVQRANKPENPFMYSITVGGHISSGESPDETVIREASEELNIDVVLAQSPEEYGDLLGTVDLKTKAVIQKVGEDPWHMSIRKTQEGEQRLKRTHQYEYVGRYDGEVKYKDGEAQGILKITVDELKDLLEKKPEDFTDSIKDFVKKYT